MKRTIQVILAFPMAAIVIFLMGIVPYGTIKIYINDFTMIAVVTIVGFIWGRRLPLLVRTIFTILIFRFGFSACITGCRKFPGINYYAFATAFYYFILLSGLPAISLLRLWKGKVALALIIAIFPLSLISAFLFLSLFWKPLFSVITGT